MEGTGEDWIGEERTGLERSGKDWIGRDWIGLERNGLAWFHKKIGTEMKKNDKKI